MLALVQQGCLERQSYLSAHQTISYLPIYVAHARGLRARRRLLEDRLLVIGAPDLTFVLCADASDVGSLDIAARQCLHPSYTRTRWSPASGQLSNGTLSLALKHRLAHWDMLHRRMPAALVIEDDAFLPANLWDQIAEYHVPTDAHLFFLGSYSPNKNPRMTLSSAPSLTWPHHRKDKALTVHRREAVKEPLIIGTVAYVVFASGARLLQRPVYAEADVDLTLLQIEKHCSANPCINSAPPNQYGPSNWIVWPVPNQENTHHSGAGPTVSERWKLWCAQMRKQFRPLNKNCARFGGLDRTIKPHIVSDHDPK